MKKGLNITLSVVSKITEILHWIAATVSVLLLGIHAVDKNFFPEVIAEECGTGGLFVRQSDRVYKAISSRKNIMRRS